MVTVDLLTSDYSIAVASAILVLLTYLPSNRKPRVRRHLEWAGGAASWIARLFTPILILLKPRQVMDECYEKVNRTQRPCLLPSILGHTVVLPTSWIPWLSAQPESVLSTRQFQENLLNIRTSMLHDDILDNPIHAKLIARKLNGSSEQLIETVLSEIEHAFEQQWGSDTDNFKSVDLYYTLSRVVASATNRVLLGPELSRNPEYIENAISFVWNVLRSGILLNLFPKFIRPFLGSIFTLPTKYRLSRCAKYLRPLFDETKKVYMTDPSSLPETYATWSVEEAMNRPVQPRDQDTKMLTLRVMILNLVMGHNVTVFSTTTLLDIFSSPPPQKASEKLLAESTSLSKQFGSSWTRPRLNKMIRLDSSIRESMRISSFITRVLNRDVVPAQGMTLPDGTHLKAGTTVCVSGYGIQHDPNIFPDPWTYHHDRFLESIPRPPVAASKKRFTSKTSLSTMPEEDIAPPSNEEEGEDSPFLRLAKPASSMDPTHLIWGLGKHSCTGRQFAVEWIKMIVDHAISNYEIEPIAKRPENSWLEYYMLPPRGARLNIRRRKDV